MKITFREVAIFDPSKSVKKLHQSSITHWIQNAMEKGADAFYPRIYLLPKTQALNILSIFTSTHSPILCPASLYSGFLNNNCPIHHRSQDKLISNPKTLIGKSCHNLAEVQDAEQTGYHYAFLSPIFPTKSHPERAALGLKILESIANQTNIPIFALGGITDNTKAAASIHAGAWGTAGIEKYII